MKASELRIGNWIQDIDPGDCYQIDEIKENGFYAGRPLGVFPAGMEFDYGIKITEEWLLKFGFEINNDGITKYILKLPIKGSNENEIASIKHTENNNWWACATTNGYWASNNIEYIHQLQNLYFALTGTELAITN